VINNEIAIFKSIWVDSGFGPTQLYWIKEKLCDLGGGEIFNSETFLTNILKNAIGTIRAAEIDPMHTSSPTLIPYVSWDSDKWKWHVPNPPNDVIVTVPIGTRVNVDGIYYILMENGVYKKEEIFNKLQLLDENIGIVTVTHINPPLGSEPQTPFVRYVNTPLPPKKWIYYPNGNTTEGITLDYGTKVKLRAANSLEKAKYYTLNDDGTYTEEIYIGTTRRIENLSDIRQGDSLLAGFPASASAVDLDAIHLLLVNKYMSSITLRCNNVNATTSVGVLTFAGFNGTVNYFIEEGGDLWVVQIEGRDKNSQYINEFYTY
jgi:hypothetical protein